MTRPQLRALDIATQIVIAKVANDNATICAANGQLLADYFKAIYENVLEITETVSD